MLAELRKVIPAFLTRLERPERGGVWSRYLADTAAATRAVGGELLRDVEAEPPPGGTLGGPRGACARGGWRAPRRRGAGAAAGGHAHRLGPRGRGESGGRRPLRRVRPARRSAPRARAQARARGARARARDVRGNAGEPPSQAGPRLRAHRVPLRRAGRLRRVPRSAADRKSTR